MDLIPDKSSYTVQVTVWANLF